MRIAVIADDLTGALDTGVQFSNWGFLVHVTDAPLSTSADVVVVNTDSRNVSPKEAYDLVYKLSQKLTGFDIIYKKIDSTMRGNVGTELQAVLDATGEKTAVLTPCYPPTARSVKDGRLLVDGVPVEETEYSAEHSSKTSVIAELLGADLKPPVVQVIDSDSESDLMTIVRNLHGQRILAGSAGLAAAFAESHVNPSPVLSIIGSQRTVTQKQIMELVRRLNVKLVTIDPHRALRQEPQDEAISVALEALGEGRDVVVSSAPDSETVEKTIAYSESLGLSPEILENRITRALAEVARKIIESQPLSGLILSGGATAMALYVSLSVDDISIIDEFRPGIPLLKLGEMNAITKAGGFGELDALVHATQYLKRKCK